MQEILFRSGEGQIKYEEASEIKYGDIIPHISAFSRVQGQIGYIFIKTSTYNCTFSQ